MCIQNALKIAREASSVCTAVARSAMTCKVSMERLTFQMWKELPWKAFVCVMLCYVVLFSVTGYRRAGQDDTVRCELDWCHRYGLQLFQHNLCSRRRWQVKIHSGRTLCHLH